MNCDFTLRGVMLRDAGGTDPRRWDLVVRDGRLWERRPARDPHATLAYLTPGFHDAHVHLLHEGLVRTRCDFSGCASLAEALKRLEAYCRRAPAEAAAIWGERWDESAWPERRGPTPGEIDRIERRRPVVLRRICGHRAALNSEALRVASGPLGPLDPGGQLVEEQAWGLAKLWPPTPQERARALLAAQETAFALGITRVSEMGATGALDAYRALARSGQLRLTVLLYLRPTQIDEALELREETRAQETRGHETALRLGGIKIFTDGSIGARTAALREPYAGTPDERGLLLMNDADLRDCLRRCRACDLPVAIHAIGDRALDQVIGELAHLAGDAPLPAGWASVEHAELVDDELLAVARRIGLTLSMQPNFVAQWDGPGGLYDEALGAARRRRMNPFAEVRRRGIPLTFGSDCMPIGPAVGLRGATSHPEPTSRLDPEQALRVYLGCDQHHPAARPRTRWWAPALGEPVGDRDWAGAPVAPASAGRGGFVVYREDPLRLTEGRDTDAPVAGVWWRGAWVQEPEASLEALETAGS